MLENARSGLLGAAGQTERVVERMNVKGVRVVDGVKIAVAAQDLAHAFGRPALDRSVEFLSEHADERDHLVAFVHLGDVEPAAARLHPGHVAFVDGHADICESGIRQGP